MKNREKKIIRTIRIEQDCEKLIREMHNRKQTPCSINAFINDLICTGLDVEKEIFRIKEGYFPTRKGLEEQEANTKIIPFPLDRYRSMA